MLCECNQGHITLLKFYGILRRFKIFMHRCAILVRKSGNKNIESYKKLYFGGGIKEL